MKRMVVNLALVVLAIALAGQSAPPEGGSSGDAAVETARKVATTSPFSIIREAKQALDAEDFSAAVTLLEQAMQAMPGEASLPYNLGVAKYRQGDFEGASKAFSRAAEIANDPNLKARSAFNQGTSTYAQALKHLQEGNAPESMEEPLKQSIDLVGNSLEQLKGAIEANPEDRDARANAELAHRLLKQLEELQQQMQQQQQQQDQQQQNQDQQQDQQDQQQQNEQQQEQQQQDQQQSSDQQQDQQQQQQQQNQENEQQQNQEQQQSQSEQQQEEQQQEQQSQAEQQEQEQQEEQQQQQQQEPQPSDDDSEAEQEPREGEAQPREGEMTREQAERLLQMVRDKQRERRQAQAAQRSSGRKPAARDW